MQLHKDELCLNFAQDAFDELEGVVRRVVHAAPADEVDDGHVAERRFKHAPAAAGLLLRQVRRAQHLARPLKIGHELAPAPGVVPHGDNVGPGAQQLLRLRGQHAQHGGVFAVHNAEIDRQLPAQPRERRLAIFDTGRRDHIADRQNVSFHRRISFPDIVLSLSKKSFRTFRQAEAFPNCKIKFCSMILQFCRCGGGSNAKGHPDGFLSHVPSLRNFQLSVILTICVPPFYYIEKRRKAQPENKPVPVHCSV